MFSHGRPRLQLRCEPSEFHIHPSRIYADCTAVGSAFFAAPNEVNAGTVRPKGWVSARVIPGTVYSIQQVS